MAVFPLATRQDSKHYSETPEDPTMRSEMEGGYVVSRPRHTRTPRMTYTTGFTSLDQVSKETFETFVKDMRVGSNSFDWQNPVTGATVLVRFKKPPKYKYTGAGGTHLWDIADITLEEV